MSRSRRLRIKQGLDKFIGDVTLLRSDTEHIIDAAVYDGAGVVAGAYRQAIRQIPVDDRIYVPDGIRKFGLLQEQKDGLLKGMGISPFQRDVRGTNKKVGMDGYNSIRTKRWPSGQPNSVVARSLAAGTTFLHPNDFVGKARRAIQEQCKQKMAETIQKEVARRIAGG